MSEERSKNDPFRQRKDIDAFVDYNHIEFVEMAEDHAVCTLTIRPESLNVYGFVHGGVLYSIADEVSGGMSHTDGRAYVTQSSNINFISNQRSGTLTGTATVRHRGKTTCIIEVIITGEKGKLIATGTFNYYCVGGKAIEDPDELQAMIDAEMEKRRKRREEVREEERLQEEIRQEILRRRKQENT